MTVLEGGNSWGFSVSWGRIVRIGRGSTEWATDKEKEANGKKRSL